jgi:ribosomal protein S11
LKYKNKKRYLNFRERLVLSKKNLNRKRYYLFFTKKRNNLFLTITDTTGRVIISQSAGSCKITTKKKKRSPDTLKAVSTSVAKLARTKNIKYLFKFFMSTNQTRVGKTIFESFKKLGLFILQGVVVRTKTHGLLMRKKKAKRL